MKNSSMRFHGVEIFPSKRINLRRGFQMEEHFFRFSLICGNLLSMEALI